MGVCNVPLVDKVCDAVGGVVEMSGQAITNGIGAWIAKSMGELAASSADLAATAVNTTTNVDLNASWFRDNYEMLLPIGLVLIVATFCAQLIRAAVRRDEQALSQAVTGTVVGIMFQFGAIAFTSVALTVVDALSDGVFAAGGTNIEAAVRRIVQVSTFGAMFPLGWAVVALVALACAICMFIYWGVMVARKVAILILVTLAVFAGAGGGWEAARRWRRGWIEATATLVISKLLMTIVFVLGVAAMGKSNNPDGMAALSDAMAGIVVMCLVLCCPLITFKFVHWAGESANGADLTTSAGTGAQMAAGAAKNAARKGKAMMAPPTGAPAFPGASNGVATGIPAPGGGPNTPAQQGSGQGSARGGASPPPTSGADAASAQTSAGSAGSAHPAPAAAPRPADEAGDNRAAPASPASRDAPHGEAPATSSPPAAGAPTSAHGVGTLAHAAQRAPATPAGTAPRTVPAAAIPASASPGSTAAPAPSTPTGGSAAGPPDTPARPPAT